MAKSFRYYLNLKSTIDFLPNSIFVFKTNHTEQRFLTSFKLQSVRFAKFLWEVTKLECDFWGFTVSLSLGTKTIADDCCRSREACIVISYVFEPRKVVLGHFRVAIFKFYKGRDVKCQDFNLIDVYYWKWYLRVSYILMVSVLLKVQEIKIGKARRSQVLSDEWRGPLYKFFNINFKMKGRLGHMTIR